MMETRTDKSHMIILGHDPELRTALAGLLEGAGYAVRAEQTVGAVMMEVPPEGLPPLSYIERLYIEHVLAETRFNLSKASRILSIDRTTLYNKLRRYGLSRESLGDPHLKEAV